MWNNVNVGLDIRPTEQTEVHQDQPSVILDHDSCSTAVEAARTLGVTRQFLIKLLNENEIAYHTVGTRRRVYVRDLLAYKSKRDSKRRQILNDLTRAEAKDGLYELEPPDGLAR